MCCDGDFVDVTRPNDVQGREHERSEAERADDEENDHHPIHCDDSYSSPPMDDDLLLPTTSTIKRLGDINAELRDVQGRVKEYRTLMNAAALRVATAEKTEERLSKRKLELREELNEVKTKLKETEQEIDAQEQEVKRQKTLMEAEESKQKEVQSRKDALVHDVEVAKKDLLQRIEAITSQCPEFTQDVQRTIGSAKKQEGAMSTRSAGRRARSEDEKSDDEEKTKEKKESDDEKTESEDESEDEDSDEQGDESNSEEDDIACEWQMYVMNIFLSARRKHTPTKENLLNFALERKERGQPVPRRLDKKSLDRVYDRLIRMRILDYRALWNKPGFKKRVLYRMRDEKQKLEG